MNFMSLSEEESITTYDKLLRNMTVNTKQVIDMLRSPVPKSFGSMKLTIERKKGVLNRLCPKYYLTNSSGQVFLMNCKKNFKSKTPYYHMSTKMDEFDSDKESYLGKLRGNNCKDIYHLYDNGGNQ